MPRAKRDRLLGYLERRSPASGPELCRFLGITRQALSQRLAPLISSGAVIKSGTTRGARYFIASNAPAIREARRVIELRGADESRVYDEMAARLGFASALRPNVASTLQYAFTEMLNNAIDHSKAAHCRVEVGLDAAWLAFEVKDGGIGVYQSIAAKHGLPDEQTAMIELIKGKTTTMPEAHSGEGLFFTCRAADRLILRSHKIQLEWSQTLDDVFVSVPRLTNGTTVRFEIRRDSRRKLEDVFAEFAPREFDYRFEKTRVLVKLLQSDYVSRSEAKRLVLNLDKFAEIDLDMRGVRRLGQGFADEVFRVFAAKHPGTRVRVLNANPNVAAMVRHAGGSAS